MRGKKERKRREKETTRLVVVSRTSLGVARERLGSLCGTCADCRRTDGIPRHVLARGHRRCGTSPFLASQGSQANPPEDQRSDSARPCCGHGTDGDRSPPGLDLG